MFNRGQDRMNCISYRSFKLEIFQVAFYTVRNISLYLKGEIHGFGFESYQHIGRVKAKMVDVVTQEELDSEKIKPMTTKIYRLGNASEQLWSLLSYVLLCQSYKQIGLYYQSYLLMKMQSHVHHFSYQLLLNFPTFSFLTSGDYM